jgi:Flp pilus assembly pilin Flp
MNRLNPLGNPVFGYLRTVAGLHLARLAQARRQRDAGASAIELAIITAVLVILAVAIGIVISNVVKNKCTTIAAQGGGSGSCP